MPSVSTSFRHAPRCGITVLAFLSFMSVNAQAAVTVDPDEDKKQPSLSAGKADSKKRADKKTDLKKNGSEANEVPGSIEQLLVLGRRPNATTDGTGTYTVRAVTTTKMLMKPQDVPQSISVLSTQQMKDQNLNTIDAALKQVAGVNVNLYGDGTAGYSARGFQLQAQYDGVPTSGSLNLSQQYDLAIYDRIEVLRGPSGLLQGAGTPAGSVNFVHKRPTDQFQANGSFSAGSWNNYHAMIDVGGPIGNSKIVSTRLVMAGTDRDFFYKNASDRRWTIYSATDFRLTHHDTLSVMVSYQGNDTTRFMGLPRSATGGDLNLARSTFIGSNWNTSSAPMVEVEGQWEHVFSHGWRARVNGRHRTSDTTLQYAYVSSYNAAAQTANFTAANTKYSEVNDGVDGYFTGPVHLFGQTHTLMAGADYNHYVYQGGGASLTATSNPQLRGISIFSPDRLSSITLPTIRNRYREPSDQWGVYGQALIKPVSTFSILLGGRISGYVSKEQQLGPTRGPMETSINQQGILTPYIGGVWRVIPAISLYASYTSIFSPQSAYDTQGRLAPVRGNQIEGGIKGDLFNHGLGFTVAGYKIIERNESIYNSSLGMVCGPSHNDDCYLSTGKTRSQGAEVEVIGRPARGWDINASYTFNDNTILNNGNATQAGLAYAPNSPRHLWKLWTHYRFEPYVGAENNIWSIGGGINAQSGTFGTNRLVTQKGYIVASAQVGYQWNRHLEATATLNNISNTRYYQRLGNLNYYNYYGEPRNFMFTLRSNF
ncbi:TonB-dependent siderophore receptor [Acetobacter sicerae]|uniref:TonB-dependent siderophore receptor n=1 Tax=Acetobacter sicerae TaxID=85325 RepID=UPI00156B74F6|nr:TonB-dependent siderophore receptor [Acetobacter sicerae]NHN91272.1 TonB-dependent siderophore receptor [Acetobacter sicerae]